MSSLQAQNDMVQRQIAFASVAFAQLKRGAYTDIGDALYVFQQCLHTTVLAIDGVLEKQDPNRLSLARLKTRSQKTKAFKQAATDVQQMLELASINAAECLEVNTRHHLKSRDFPRYHVDPARRSVQALRAKIKCTEDQANLDIQKANYEASYTRGRLESVKKDLQRNEASMRDNESRIRSINNQILQTGRQQRNYQNERNQKQQEASELREKASNRRLKGTLVGVMTLGLGAVYTAYQFDQAKSNEYDADQAERRCRDISGELMSLQVEESNLQDNSRRQKSRNEELNSSNLQLESILTSQITRISRLQSHISNLELQIREAQKLEEGTGQLDGWINALASDVKGLQGQLMRMKHKLDGLAAMVEEQKDLTIALEGQGKRLTMTKRGRKELYATLAYTASDLRAVLQDVEGKRQLLLESAST